MQRSQEVDVKYSAASHPVDDPDYHVILAYLRYLREVYPEIRAHILDFLNDLLRHTEVTAANMDAILRGAYTVVHGDGCHLYRKYAPFQYKKKGWLRMSSHGEHMEGAYRMGAGSLAVCTGGKTRVHCDGGGEDALNHGFDVLLGCHRATGDTAFQFEKTRMDTDWNALGHAKTFLKYASKKRQKNIGAFGTSTRVDKRPLMLRSCKQEMNGRPCDAYKPEPLFSSRPADFLTSTIPSLFFSGFTLPPVARLSK